MRASATQRWSPKNNLQEKKKLTLRLTQSNQWVRADHAARIHSLISIPITSNVEKKGK